MKKPFRQIKIETPCSEKTENMEVSEAGFFCRQCSKDVHDFRDKSPEEIIAFFREHTGKNCGAFLPGQLETVNRKLRPEPSGFQTWARRIMPLGFLLLSGSLAAKPLLSPTEISDRQSVKSESDSTNKFIVRGQVRYVSDSVELPGVTVLIKNTDTGTNTDMDGFFELDLQFYFREKDSLTLEFSFIGYKTQEYVIYRDKPVNDLTINMIEDMRELAGDMSVGGAMAKPPLHKRIYYKIRNVFRRNN